MPMAITRRLIPLFERTLQTSGPITRFVATYACQHPEMAWAFWTAVYRRLNVKIDTIPVLPMLGEDVVTALDHGLSLIYWAPELEQISLRDLLSQFENDGEPVSVEIPYREDMLIHSSPPGWYWVYRRSLIVDGESNSESDACLFDAVSESGLVSDGGIVSEEVGVYMSLPLYLLFAYVHYFITGELPDDGLTIALTGTFGSASSADAVAVRTDQRRGNIAVLVSTLEHMATDETSHVRFCIRADQLSKLNLPSH